MRVDWKQNICGESPISLRNMLRRLGSGYFSWHYVSEWFGSPNDHAKGRDIIEELLKRGWIEPRHDEPAGIYYGPAGADFYRTTLTGNAFAAANAMRRIPRERAKRYLEVFMNRLLEVNADDRYAYYVPEAFIFGSYLDTNAADLGDIDIALDLAQRPIINRDIVKYRVHRADLYGPLNLGFMGWLDFADSEVMRALRGRNPYISLCPLRDLKATGAKWELLYRAPAEDAVQRHARPNPEN